MTTTPMATDRPPAPIVRTAVDIGVPASAAAMVDRIGIRMIAERVAAVARLSGQARVLITGCRNGDGASTVAGALALDLSLRLSVETLLVDADSGSSAEAAEIAEAVVIKAGGNGRRPIRANPTPVTRLWTLRCARISDQAHQRRGPAQQSAGPSGRGGRRPPPDHGVLSRRGGGRWGSAPGRTDARSCRS